MGPSKRLSTANGAWSSYLGHPARSEVRTGMDEERETSYPHRQSSTVIVVALERVDVPNWLGRAHGKYSTVFRNIFLPGQAAHT